MDKALEELKPRLRGHADEIESIDQQVDTIGKSLVDIDKKIAQLQEEVTDITSDGKRSAIEKLIAASEEFQQELEGIEGSFNDIQRQLDRIETEEKVEQGNRANLQAQLDTVLAEIAEVKAQTPAHEARIAELHAAIEQIDAKVGELSEELEQLRATKDQIHDKCTGIEIEKTKIDQDLIHLEEERQTAKLAHLEFEEELVALKAELAQILAEEPNWQPPSEGSVEQLKSQVERLEKRMRSMEPVNMKALDEYNTTKQREAELEENLQTLGYERDVILQRISGYDELKKRTFMEAYDSINQNFQDIFAELSHGHGRLELENPENPFLGGLIIRAQPRDKECNASKPYLVVRSR